MSLLSCLLGEYMDYSEGNLAPNYDPTIDDWGASQDVDKLLIQSIGEREDINNPGISTSCYG